MGPSSQRRPEAGPAAVELLDGAVSAPARPEPGSTSLARTVVSMTAVGLALFALMSLPTGSPVQAGRLHQVDVRFADPFEVEWLALAPQDDRSASPAHPEPMASLDPPCVGFGRPDWPEEHRQPTVAHCASSEDIADLNDGGVALVRQILVGPDTWYLLRFGGELAGVEVDAGPTFVSDDRSTVPPERIYRVGPYAAVLLPNRLRPFEVTWELRGGSRYRCGFGGMTSC